PTSRPEIMRRIVALSLVASVALTASSCAITRGGGTASAKVGPPHGAAIVVGGGNVGRDIMSRFIQLAGGPDALIIDVPTAGGAPTYTQTTAVAEQIRHNGARNVFVLHTKDRKLADSDSFVAIIKKAGGIWFEGGRQNLLVDTYGGTKAEAEFHNVLARGGVEAGSSAGASIQGSFLIRGASNGNETMDAPGRNVGFGFLRGVGIDQHVVARERLPDLADSVMKKYPDLLFISEDEGTAWLVQGDNAEIIGRNKAFVYNGKDTTDSGKPFTTLRPGDRYNLATRHVTHRAIDDSPLKQAWVDSLFRAAVGSSAATVLVAQGGKVFINSSYNVPPQRRYMPTTTMPNFALGDVDMALHGVAAQWLIGEKKMAADEPLEDGGSVTVGQFLAGTDVADGEKKLVALMAKKAGVSAARLVMQRVLGAPGTHKTEFDTATAGYRSNVDEMYRMELALFSGVGLDTTSAPKSPLGWHADTFHGVSRQAVYGTSTGKRTAYMRFPDQKAAIIILTDGETIDARGLAEAIAGKLLSAR
ncbi:MAG TPA: cyanophycinase, partial [Gemmatimonadaceae bacterium]